MEWKVGVCLYWGKVIYKGNCGPQVPSEGKSIWWTLEVTGLVVATTTTWKGNDSFTMPLLNHTLMRALVNYFISLHLYTHQTDLLGFTFIIFPFYMLSTLYSKRFWYLQHMFQNFNFIHRNIIYFILVLLLNIYILWWYSMFYFSFIYYEILYSI